MVTPYQEDGAKRAETGMSSDLASEPKRVIGPSGEPLTVDTLPPPDTRRWVARRKAEVVAAVRGGLLSRTEALERYRLSEEEFASWQQSIEQHGLAGLRTTRLQHYRRLELESRQ
jgi:hypothetical protein